MHPFSIKSPMRPETAEFIEKHGPLYKKAFRLRMVRAFPAWQEAAWEEGANHHSIESEERNLASTMGSEIAAGIAENHTQIESALQQCVVENIAVNDAQTQEWAVTVDPDHYKKLIGELTPEEKALMKFYGVSP